MVPGGEHTLGGIAGEAVSETTDSDPARVELVADVAEQLGGLHGDGGGDVARRLREDRVLGVPALGGDELVDQVGQLGDGHGSSRIGWRFV